MLSATLYLIRSKADGQYLVARPRAANPDAPPDPGFLLLFKEHADALSYLNTHASGLMDRFGVESIPGSQLKTLMGRWGFTGIGMVQDPLVPEVEFARPDHSLGFGF
ncbi:MAG: hypothetical protein KME07_00730 [Pegethrix bostrychoides GSE-TBD4-15B]|jgi:hypothetical protein|uniref:Uncharacterized protein n=1 Tax=Pegethrix bostrychoides GSE-TBD4-15B TaxID=2839662 RepID=A0A951P720_9CYAN|nr:hypothetical protein [Pegethrix bostrychoides GSE-TBD4-15B]